MAESKASDGFFVWHELMTKDVKGAIAYYSEVTGWKTQPFEGGKDDYTMWVSKQGPLGGVLTLPEAAEKMGAPPHWMGNVQVADVDAATAKVKELGGRVYQEPFDIPTIGRVAVVADPQGASLALFKPAQPMGARNAWDEGEFCWNELLTSDSAAAAKFYTDVIGWKIVQEMDMGPMGTYRIFGVGDKQLGGMMTLPPGAPMPPAWLYYTETNDLEAAVKRATNHGGKLLNGPMDVPGGRIAQFMDPQGAAFALHQASKKD